MHTRTPPRWWSPNLSPFWFRVLRPYRHRLRLRMQRLERIDFVGLEHVRDAVAAGHGVLLTPNHSCHLDAAPLIAMGEEIGLPPFFMTAWQVLADASYWRRTFLRWHGCFSVDREGTDLRAFREAVRILKEERSPLVVFPEGEIYHLNERVTIFREGPATMALAAAKRADRPVVCIPCGIRYFYLDDPTPRLLELADRVERQLLWRPRPDLPLPQRIYRIAEGLLVLKEFEYLGAAGVGDLPSRIGALISALLEPIEARHATSAEGKSIPERVKMLRQSAIKRLEAEDLADDEHDRLHAELDDVFLVTQLYSYPGDYVAEQPSLERIAETLDKFEEDVLRVQPATIRGRRRAVLRFGEPIDVGALRESGVGAEELTQRLEDAVQSLLDAGDVLQSESPETSRPSSSSSSAT